MEFVENAKEIKLSERTQQIFIALAAFEESFHKLCELLTEKSDDEKIQEVYENMAEKDLNKVREYQAKTFVEIKNLAKEIMFQTFLGSDHKEI